MEIVTAEHERILLQHGTDEWRVTMKGRFPREVSMRKQLGQGLRAHRVFRCFHRVVSFVSFSSLSVNPDLFARSSPSEPMDRCIRDLMCRAKVACNANTLSQAEALLIATNRFCRSRLPERRAVNKRALIQAASVYISVLIREELVPVPAPPEGFRVPRSELGCMWEEILTSIRQMRALFADHKKKENL